MPRGRPRVRTLRAIEPPCPFPTTPRASESPLLIVGSLQVPVNAVRPGDDTPVKSRRAGTNRDDPPVSGQDPRLARPALHGYEGGVPPPPLFPPVDAAQAHLSSLQRANAPLRALPGIGGRSTVRHLRTGIGGELSAGHHRAAE